MNRQEVEDKVSAIYFPKKPYSPHGNNLKGGVVQYSDGNWILEVLYKSGAPAPLVKNPDGLMQLFLPKH